MGKKEFAIIVAGGKGTRIKSILPKQFVELCGKPMLFHTLEAFYRYSPQLQIVLVLPADDFQVWNDLVRKHGFTIPVTVQSGGDTRFQSVKRGLEKVDNTGLVAIHDGVRPLVSEDIIAASFRLAAVHGTAVTAVRLKDSIRMTDQDTTRAVDRSKFRLIQTPQTFDIELIKKAYQQREDPSFTDDASVVDLTGLSISLFEGSYENIKVTTAEDLLVAEALLEARS